jgi:lysophospholipase
MGGHLALRAVAERALDPQPAALVLSARCSTCCPKPCRSGSSSPSPGCNAGSATRVGRRGSGARSPASCPAFRQALLTHDGARYADELYWRRVRPELVMGPGSWGWVAAAMASARGLARPGVLEAIDLPVHLFATSADRLVGTRAIRRAAARLPRWQFALVRRGSRARNPARG